MPHTHVRPVGTNGQPVIHPPKQPCPHCCSPTENPMLVTSMVVYYRCTACGQTWSVDRLMAEPHAI
jgi:hypothetical protein